MREQVWPEPRDADELHDALMTLGILPDVRVGEAWQAWMQRLQQQGRAVRVRLPSLSGWIAAERAGLARAAWSSIEL